MKLLGIQFFFTERCILLGWVEWTLFSSWSIEGFFWNNKPYLYNVSFLGGSYTMLIFINCLDNIIKQFTMVGLLKEQQVQSHKRTQIFIIGNPHGVENTTKLPHYRTQPKQCKTPRQLLLSLSGVFLVLSLANFLEWSEYKWRRHLTIYIWLLNWPKSWLGWLV